MAQRQEEELEDAAADEWGVSPSDVMVSDGEAQLTPSAAEELQADTENERETGIGQWLEVQSDRWQSGAEQVGSGLTNVLPDVPMIAGTDSMGVPVMSDDEEMDDVFGGAVETGLSTLDPAGATLAAGDAAQTAGEELYNYQEHRLETGLEFRDEVTSENVDAGEAASLGGEALTGSGYLRERGEAAAMLGMEAGQSLSQDFDDRPLETSFRGIGAGTAAVVAPTAARSAVGRARNLDLSPRGDMIGRGANRGQMELTLQRTRTRTRDPDELPVRDQPADPTAPTAAGRTPPRDAFPSDDAYQQAVRRREEEIARETADSTPVEVGPDATPVEQVRANRHLFDDPAEFQRELEAARQMQRSDAQDMDSPFGDPSPGGSTTTTSAAQDPDFDSSQGMDSMFGDPSIGGTTTTGVTTEPDTESMLDSGMATGDLGGDTTTSTDEFMGMDSSATAGGQTTDTTTTTTTGMAEPSPAVTETAMPEPMRTVTRTRLGDGPGQSARPMWPEPERDPGTTDSGFGTESGGEGWQTGFLQPEDIDSDFFGGGASTDEHEWWF
ncbi:hypothetical protein [Natronorubrum halophilum]|uniref:hypothetical protein n=1 Tax=Natronorubrum halophilum TaxID=1702106 RepID=UPI0013CEEB02|nr:hypothetical protein [Natronorubrum halophilum]